ELTKDHPVARVGDLIVVGELAKKLTVGRDGLGVTCLAVVRVSDPQLSQAGPARSGKFTFDLLHDDGDAHPVPIIEGLHGLFISGLRLAFEFNGRKRRRTILGTPQRGGKDRERKANGQGGGEAGQTHGRGSTLPTTGEQGLGEWTDASASLSG